MFATVKVKEMAMQRKKYLIKNTLLFSLNSIGTKLIVFFLVPLYTKAFTTAEYGIIDLVTTIATLLVPIITLNIGEAVMRFSLDEDANQNEIMSVGVFFIAFSFVLGFSVIGVISYFPAIIVDKKLIYVYCVAQGVYQTLSCNLRGQEKLLNYAVGNVLNTFAAAAFNIVFLIVLKIGINGYFYAYICAYLIASIYCFIIGDVAGTIKRYHLNRRLLKNMVKYSIVLVPNSLMWWIMNSSDHIMVTAMLGTAANGVYAISYKIPSILSALSTVFNQAWSYSAIHENKSADREEFNNNMYDNMVRFLVIATIFIMCITKPFLKIYVQSEYYSAWKYIPYLMVGSFFLTLGTFLSTFYTVNKDSKGFLFSGTAGAIVNIILNWLLIPEFAIHGAAFATCVSYIIVFLYRVKDTRKYMVVHVFKPIYIIEYILLILTALSMMIISAEGQVILIVEFVIALVLNYRFILEILKGIKNIVKR